MPEWETGTRDCPEPGEPEEETQEPPRQLASPPEAEASSGRPSPPAQQAMEPESIAGPAEQTTPPPALRRSARVRALPKYLEDYIHHLVVHHLGGEGCSVCGNLTESLHSITTQPAREPGQMSGCGPQQHGSQ